MFPQVIAFFSIIFKPGPGLNKPNGSEIDHLSNPIRVDHIRSSCHPLSGKAEMGKKRTVMWKGMPDHLSSIISLLRQFDLDGHVDVTRLCCLLKAQKAYNLRLSSLW